MKRTLCLLSALMLLLAACLPALADEVPQPEGGKKFEGCWAFACGLAEIVYEEEGYRVSVDLYNMSEKTGVLWQYACLYDEGKDALVSMSSSKTPYTLEDGTSETILGEEEYEGLDLEGEPSVFTLSSSGMLHWQDGRENMGADLEFAPIGRFDGVWHAQDGSVYTEFHWQGLMDENLFCYFIYIGRGEEDCHMVGMYDAASGRLNCRLSDLVSDTVPDLDAFTASTEPFDAFFTDLGDGKMLYESGDEKIELEYDLLGPIS